ncbi:accessory gene regulator B family protein [Brevibacillus humidisoli]|uniref:accessory gene regulator ArgB-like protein n=1 Tax=Brevibacillus humidisoli TaxID=2895522 RepID=UPI001E639CC3|nr:accessory gene regulator B family protein [Brevibacillus humidisoli]UFJ39997.1 accessory gene regulator B family protein [Brevibacillus humidisoli]
MSWTEKVSNRLARRLVTEGSPYSLGQISHGIEIFLLMVLNAAFLLVVSYILGCFMESVVIGFIYMLHRNFTGGVHFRNQSACFFIGNALMIGLALIVKSLPSVPDVFSYSLISISFVLSYLVNARHAPAKHIYVEYDPFIIKRNRTIILRLLIFGCLLSYLLVYFAYSKFAFAYTVAILLQSILLHPVIYRLVESIEHKFFKGVDL